MEFRIVVDEEQFVADVTNAAPNLFVHRCAGQLPPLEPPGYRVKHFNILLPCTCTCEGGGWRGCTCFGKCSEWVYERVEEEAEHRELTNDEVENRMLEID